MEIRDLLRQTCHSVSCENSVEVPKRKTSSCRFLVGRRSTSTIDSVGHVESSETYRMVSEKSEEKTIVEYSRSTVRRFGFLDVHRSICLQIRFVVLHRWRCVRIDENSTRRRSETEVRGEVRRTNGRRAVSIDSRCLKRADKSHATSMYLVEPETCSYVMGVSRRKTRETKRNDRAVFRSNRRYFVI